MTKCIVKNLITMQLLRKFGYLCDIKWASQVALVVKNLPTNAGNIRDTGSITESKDPLEEGMAIHSSILAWRIPWSEESGGLQSIESQRVGHVRNN